MNLKGMDPETIEFMKSVHRNRYKRDAIKSDMKPSLMVRVNRLKSDGMNIIVSVAGETGVGKSTTAWVFGEWILTVYREEMKAYRMMFDDGELLEMMEESDLGDVYIKDEQVDTYGPGSNQMSSQLQNIEMTVRKGEVSLIYCSPDVKMHSHHYIFEPVLKLWNCKLFPWIKNRNQVFSWVYKTTGAWNKQAPMGFLLTGLPRGTSINEKAKTHRKKIIFPLEYKKYLKNKDEFIAKVKRGDVSSGSSFIEDKTAEEFIKNEDLMEYKRNKDILTALKRIDKPYNRNFTSGQLSQITELIKVKCKERGIETRWKQ